MPDWVNHKQVGSSIHTCRMSDTELILAVGGGAYPVGAVYGRKNIAPNDAHYCLGNEVALVINVEAVLFRIQNQT